MRKRDGRNSLRCAGSGDQELRKLAAAEAMQRILEENTQRKQSQKHGGEIQRILLGSGTEASETPLEDLMAFDEALTRLK
jgi:hypothetical protein